ncbi:MAG: HD domain-containing protein [Oscillospiraceae bacterium]|nr:HD domain-containing protein [Oscillospiraceae bacterium]
MINIPKEAQKALEMLNSAGFEAWVVGGIVRNSLMGLDVSDADITTNALPLQTAKVFEGYHLIETGLKHGTVTVIIDGTPVEITTYRTEKGYSDGRHPDEVQFTASLKEDCARRDFTINAICYNPAEGLMDFYGGVQDIENRLIRCVGNADKRFKEDGLRIIRRLRFASVLGFEIEPVTKQAIFANCHLLKNISAERIYTELNKLLCGTNVKHILMEYTDVLAEIIPEILPLKGFDQKNYHHIYDVLEHTAVAVENCPPVPQLRLAALLHDFGKPATFTIDNKGVGHFYGHDEVSLEISKDILKRLKVSGNDYNLITRLVKHHDTFIEPNEKAVRRAMNKHGEDFVKMLLLLKRADNKGQNTKDFDRTDEYNSLETIIDSVLEQNQCFSLKDLAINGNDLTQTGISPSPLTGRILNCLLEMVIDGQIANEKEILLSKVAEIQQ